MIRSARVLGKHWKLAAIAVFSLSIAMALGIIGLSISNTFLLLPPAAPAPERLAMIYAHSNTEAIDQISYLDYKYFQQNNHVFTDLAAAPNSINVTEDAEKPDLKLISRPVTGNYLAVMGIRPYLGRLLEPSDENGKTTAVMTYSCWKRLGADPNIVGKTIAGNAIAGVLPKEFTGTLYGVNGDLLIALADGNYDAESRERRNARRLFLLGRLKPGVSREQAQAEISALSAQLASAYPADDKDRTAVVTRATMLPPDGIPTAKLMTGVLMAVVLLVLLIACANVANLLLAVAVGRRQEAVIKLALGAQRSRLIREFLIESAYLCFASAALGYLIAAALMARYSQIDITFPMIGSLSFAMNLKIDATVVAFTVGLMLVAIVATGLAPALYASAPSLSQVLSGELAVGGTGKAMRRNLLVIVQVSICTLVLVGMGLCQRSLSNLRRVDPGFSERKLVAVQIYPRSENHDKNLYADLRREISSLSGVDSVTLVSQLPLLGGGGEPVHPADGAKPFQVHTSVIDENYFATFGIPLLSGRAFNSSDREKSPEVAVINRKMADMFWPGQNAVGKLISMGEKPRSVIVVGIAADGKYEDLDEAPRPFVYYALSQHEQRGLNLVARTKGDPQLWIAPIAAILRPHELLVLNPMSYENWLNLALLTERLTAGCVAALSGLGLLLAVIGLFGAISYSVSERRKELGIRVALGARPAQLLNMVLRQTVAIAGTGILIGLVLGIGATMLLRSQFYQIGAIEWTVLLPVSLAMLAVSMLVAYFSARPWLGINPMDAVRHA